jgi:hypothetical protein
MTRLATQCFAAVDVRRQLRFAETGFELQQHDVGLGVEPAECRERHGGLHDLVQVEVGRVFGLPIWRSLVGGAAGEAFTQRVSTRFSSAAMTNAIFGTARNSRMVSRVSTTVG